MIKDSSKGFYDKEYPLVSVVILTYNRFQYLWNAIDSVLLQDYPQIQIIISDDCSSDFPQEQIEKYLNKNIKSNIQSYRIVHHKTNLGTVKNLNYAYDLADGEFIFPLSNDDEFLSEDVISKLVDAFMTSKANVVISSRLRCDENGNALSLIPLRAELKYIQRMNSRRKQYRAFIMEEYYDMASGSALYVRKSFWKKIGKFDERYRLWEDGPFIAKALIHDKIQMCFDIVSIKYRIGGVSTGKKHPQLIIDKAKFDFSDKLQCLDDLDWLAVQKIKFDIARNMAKTRKEILCAYLKYPVGTIQRIIYKIKRWLASHQEKTVELDLM